VNRLIAVGVCTGAFSREQLALEKPDILVDSLGEAEHLLEELCA
jgi:phosphoglycolate phosphatase-like HAD superfamily hydrolase